MPCPHRVSKAALIADPKQSCWQKTTNVILSNGMDGRELAREALRRQPGLRVLFTAGYTRNAVIHNGRLEPGVRLIGKPFTSAELTGRVAPFSTKSNINISSG